MKVHLKKLALVIISSLLGVGVGHSVDALKPVGESISVRHLENYKIIIPDSSTPQDRYSADVLKDGLDKIFGINIPIFSEREGGEGKVISIGDTKRFRESGLKAAPEEQGYRIGEAKGDVFLVGGSRGPLYAVLALLEEDLGCRWYASSMSGLYPKASETTMTFVPRAFATPFEIREMLYRTAFDEKWSSLNKIQPISYHNFLSQEKGGGYTNPKFFIHTYAELIPAEEYFEKHPEFFPLRDGKRHRSDKRDGQLCYTNDDMAKEMAKKIEAGIAADPGSRVYSVSSNDNVHDNCECESCQAIIAADGVSGAQLFLANRVAEIVSARYPDVKITTLAYVGSQEPTKTIKPGPNTVIVYAPIRHRGDFVLLPAQDIPKIDQELTGWSKLTSNIYLWDYVDIIGGASVPFPAIDAQMEALPYLITKGVKGVFMEGNQSARSSLAELKAWVYAKKLWNPNLSTDALVSEFISGFYGGAAQKMDAYVGFQRDAWRKYYTNRQPKESFRFSDADILKMQALLEEALVLAPEGEIKERVEKELLTVVVLALSRIPKKDNVETYESNLALAEQLLGRYKVEHAGGMLPTGEAISQWKAKVATAKGEGLPSYSENSFTVKRPTCFAPAAFVDDSAAIQGKAARVNGGGDWLLQWSFSDFIDALEVGKTYVLRAKVRWVRGDADAVPKSLFKMGSYIYGVTGASTAAVSNFDLNEKGYQWVTVCKIRVLSPSSTGMLYFLTGEGMSDKDEFLFDYIEFVPRDEFVDDKDLKSLITIEI